jgi:glycosyltransferase involved in cell wall biosynthesis
MNSPVISIITIVFNGEKHLEQTIRSVLDQPFTPVQYIIIDGGSTDQSVNIIKKYEKQLYFWISEKDNGISDALNKGIARATGEIVGIIHADDWYEPGVFQMVAENFGDAEVYFGDIQLWKDQKKEFVQLGNFHLLNREMTIIHPTVFIKRETYDRLGGFDSKYRCAMDYDLLLKLKVNQCRFKYIPHVLANMRWGGFSDKQWKLGCRETLEIKNKYLPENKTSNYLYYLKHIAAILSAKSLAYLRLGSITKLYRKLFSPVKKVYDD